MKATMPQVVVPGDNVEPIGSTKPNLMARNGTCVGMSEFQAVWRFGQLRTSEAGRAYGIHIAIPRGFMWIRAFRDTGKEIERFLGPAFELPESFREILDWND